MILLAGWFVGKEVIEMMEFRTWIHEVREAPMVKPVASAGPQETFAVTMMSVANGRLRKLMDPAHAGPPGGLSFKSSSEQLHDPSGACASYSHVLAKCLLTAGIEVRKVGLQRGEVKAIHHVIEAKLDGRWALMDAFFNQVFRAPDGHLADAAEVSHDWAFFGRQVSAEYNPTFDYSGFYHTNWDPHSLGRLGGETHPRTRGDSGAARGLGALLVLQCQSLAGRRLFSGRRRSLVVGAAFYDRQIISRLARQRFLTHRPVSPTLLYRLERYLRNHRQVRHRKRLPQVALQPAHPSAEVS